MDANKRESEAELFEGRNVCVTCTRGAIGSARSHAGGDIAARCPRDVATPLNTLKRRAGFS